MIYKCTCGCVVEVDPPCGGLFTYAGKAYTMVGGGIFRVKVMDFDGTPCSICAGLVACAVRSFGVRLRSGWRFLTSRGVAYWTRENGGGLLFTFTDNISPATRAGRVPVPILSKCRWLIRAGDRFYVNHYDSHSFSPWPRDWEGHELIRAGLGIKTPHITRTKTEKILCHGVEFPPEEFPLRYTPSNSVPASVREFLLAHGHEYGLSREGVISMRDGELV